MNRLMSLVTLARILTIVFVGFGLARAALNGPKSAWPPGTTANGSTTHPLGDDGATFYASNAIDGNTLSRWNDNTRFALPDVLTIETPSPVILAGIFLLSAMDGWVLDYTVETFNGSGWALEATVTNCEGPLRYIPFIRPVKTTQLQITVTDEQDGGFTRIHEVYPVFAIGASNTSGSNPTPPDTKPFDTTKTSAVPSSFLSVPANSPKNSSTNIGAIVGGVLGGIILILFLALSALSAYIFFRKRKERCSSSYSVSAEPEKSASDESIHPAELSSHRYGIPGREPFSKAELEGT